MTLTHLSTRTTRTPVTEWTLHLLEIGSDASPGLAAGLTEGVGAAGLPASVPGSVLGTLIEHGLAPDVTVGGLEQDVEWAARATWAYRTAVPRTGDGATVTLVLEGVDTFATVRVDGEPVLTTDDMFHAWRVTLGVDDAPGEWTIDVELAPAELVARARESAAPLPRADMYETPFNQVRKMACSFGWDWGPTTITAGLYRAVTVERTPVARISDLRLAAQWESGAVLHLTAGVEGPVADMSVRVLDGDAALLAETSPVSVAPPAHDTRGAAAPDLPTASALDVTFEVPDARRWDVVGRGEQPLYTVEVQALDADGQVLDTLTRQVGFRTVTIRQEPDDAGRSFEIHVNGSRVWARGFNWIPADTLPERVERAHLRRLIEEAVATGANMLRVWGGGIVESDDFYDLCDELGVLVWQDFSFACAAYGEEPDQVASVRREVADAVARVGHRASLALWCGCNENIWGYEDWGWQDRLSADEAWGAGLYYDVIPATLHALDPHRPYIPGSPFSPDRSVHPNDQTQGPTHHWDTWNKLDYTEFENIRSRFAAEFGWQAPAAWPTLVQGVGHEPGGPADPDVQRLQKHPEGMGALARGIGDHVPHLPSDGRGWYFATQLMQARAILASIGRFRSLHDTCSGALWWQLDDCWPSLSWAVLDVAGRRKLGWHASAQVMAARAVIATADGTDTGLTLVNDLPEEWTAALTLRVVAETGVVLHEEEHDVTVPADGHLVVEPEQVPAGASAVVMDADGIRGARWIVPDLELAHPVSRLQLRGVRVQGTTATVTVTATDLVRDLCVLPETDARLPDAVVEGQLRLLLPGESHRFTITADAVGQLNADAWAGLMVAGTGLRVDVTAGQS